MKNNFFSVRLWHVSTSVLLGALLIFGSSYINSRIIEASVAGILLLVAVFPLLGEGYSLIKKKQPAYPLLPLASVILLYATVVTDNFLIYIFVVVSVISLASFYFQKKIQRRFKFSPELLSNFEQQKVFLFNLASVALPLLGIGVIALVYFLLPSQILSAVIIVAFLLSSISISLVFFSLVALWSFFFKGLEKQEIEFNNLSVLSKFPSINKYIFPLRGVVTVSSYEVVQLVSPRPQELLTFAAGLNSSLNHPISLALRDRLKSDKLTHSKAEDIRYYPAEGVIGKINGKEYGVGNLKLMHRLGVIVGVLQREIARLEKQGYSVIILGKSQPILKRQEKPGEVVGIIALSSKPRADFKEVVKAFQNHKIENWIFTSESSQTAEAIALKVGVDTNHTLSNLSEQDKQERLNRLLGENSPKGVLAAVAYDNKDIPIFKTADVSIQIGGQANSDIRIKKPPVSRLVVMHFFALEVLSKTSSLFIMSLIYHGLVALVAISLVNPVLRTDLNVALLIVLFEALATGLFLTSLWLSKKTFI